MSGLDAVELDVVRASLFPGVSGESPPVEQAGLALAGRPVGSVGRSYPRPCEIALEPRLSTRLYIEPVEGGGGDIEAAMHELFKLRRRRRTDPCQSGSFAASLIAFSTPAAVG